MSTLSFREYVSIVASTHLVYKNEPDKKEIDRSRYSPEQLKVLEETLKLESRGASVDNKILNLRFSEPLKKFADQVYNFDYFLTLYMSYKNHGLLPFEGSHADQPNKIIEVFNIINAVVTELQIKDQKKQEQQYKNQKR